jgi:hypothetical protein
MHVSNLLTAVRAVNSFSQGKGTISPFCAWVGDAELYISKGLAAAHVTDAEGKLAEGVTEPEAVTAVLMLVALRAKLRIEPDPRPADKFTE